jgi:hypothetical protein
MCDSKRCPAAAPVKHVWEVCFVITHVRADIMRAFVISVGSIPMQMTAEQTQDYCKRKTTYVQKQQQGVQKV